MTRIFVLGSFLGAVLVVSCKDDSTSGTTAPAEAGAASSSSTSSSSSSSSSGSPATDSGSTCGNVTYEPVDTAAARFAGYWLIDDTGSCANASMLYIVEGVNSTNVGDPDKSSCSPPSKFMTAYARKAKDCLLGDSCQAEPVFVFFAHAQPVPPIVPPNELILVPDGNGSFKLSTNHIAKTDKGISAYISDYTPSSAGTNICP